MSKFKLQHEGFASSTSIPNCFIEKYMPKAAGEFVKIYIYLLKCVAENRSELSISKIADAMENAEKDIVRALKYWQKRGLLKLTFDEDNNLVSLKINDLTDVDNEDFDSDEIAVATGKTTQKDMVAASIESEPNKNFSVDEINAFSKQDEITQLIYIIQKYLGRTLTNADLNTILFFFDTLKMPADVIEYLFEYCVSSGHKSMRYIEKVAISWADEGIKTLKAAKMLNGIYSDNCYPVLKAFGLSGRAPSKGESDYVSKWTLSYGFSLDIILEACNRTINTIHQPSFEYADSILKRWNAQNISSLEDIKALDEARELTLANAEKLANQKAVSVAEKSNGANKFNNFNQRHYDYLQLEKKLFNI